MVARRDAVPVVSSSSTRIPVRYTARSALKGVMRVILAALASDAPPVWELPRLRVAMRGLCDVAR
ncbi:hypothetical protein GCM10025762_24550 [Haloechinothrix salitolerans]